MSALINSARTLGHGVAYSIRKDPLVWLNTAEFVPSACITPWMMQAQLRQNPSLSQKEIHLQTVIESIRQWIGVIVGGGGYIAGVVAASTDEFVRLDKIRQLPKTHPELAQWLSKTLNLPSIKGHESVLMDTLSQFETLQGQLKHDTLSPFYAKPVMSLLANHQPFQQWYHTWQGQQRVPGLSSGLKNLLGKLIPQHIPPELRKFGIGVFISTISYGVFRPMLINFILQHFTLHHPPEPDQAVNNIAPFYIKTQGLATPKTSVGITGFAGEYPNAALKVQAASAYSSFKNGSPMLTASS
jgi:hypothetical protein